MPHLQGVSREAIVLFPPTLDDYIAADNPVRFIDAFVDQLDLEALGSIALWQPLKVVPLITLATC